MYHTRRIISPHVKMMYSEDARSSFSTRKTKPSQATGGRTQTMLQIHRPLHKTDLLTDAGIAAVDSTLQWSESSTYLYPSRGRDVDYAFIEHARSGYISHAAWYHANKAGCTSDTSKNQTTAIGREIVANSTHSQLTAHSYFLRHTPTQPS